MIAAAPLRHAAGLALAIALSGCGNGAETAGDPVRVDEPVPPFSAPTAAPGPTSPGRAEAQPGPIPTSGGTGGTTPPPPAAIRFVAVGDTGKGGTDETAVAASIAHKCQTSGCDFVVLLGDNVYDSGVSSVTDPQWQTKFEEPFRPVPGPIYAVLGNHDYGGGGMGTEFGKAKHQVDYSAVSAKWRMPAEYYRFAKGDAEFFALDTNMQMFGRDAKQKEDVKRWLAASTATWKIAFGHHPYRSNGPHGNAGSYDGVPFVPVANGAGVKAFAEEVYCGRVDLYLAGHDHSRQWLTDTCNGTSLVVSGAGATGTKLEGKNSVLYQSNELGFLYVVIDGKKLTAEWVHMSGTINYARTIQK